MNILTPTGYKPIEDISVGDEVIAWNFDTSSQETNVVEVMDTLDDTYPGFVEDDIDYAFYKINGTWTFFAHQTVMINGGIGYHAFELNVGDTIYDENGNPITITTIEKISSTDPWVRFQISGDHAYIQDGIAVHNAARFWTGGGSSVNWGAITNTNWGTVSGTPSNAAVPTSADAVTFDGAGATGNTVCTVDTSARACASLSITAGYTKTITFNQILNCSGSITIATGFTAAGAASIRIIAVGTVSVTPTLAVDFGFGGTTFTATLAKALTVNATSAILFNSTGTLTMAGAFTITGGAVTYSTGTYVLSGAVIDNSAGTTFATTTGVTLVADCTATSITVSGGSALSGTFNYNCSGNLTMTAAMNLTTGSPTFVLSGGTWSGTGGVGINLTLAGNVTISGSVTYSFGTFTYSSGTITTTGSTITASSSAAKTFNLGGSTGCRLNNLTLSANYTLTLNSDLYVDGTLTSSGTTVTMAGTGVWIAANYTQTGATHKLVSGQNYKCTGTVTARGTTGAHLALICVTAAGTPAQFTQTGTSQDLIYYDGTDIDSSLGFTIFTAGGTLTRTTNWNNVIGTPVTTASVFAS